MIKRFRLQAARRSRRRLGSWARGHAVLAGAHLEDDEARDMRGHESVDRASGEHVRNGVTTNFAEGYFLQLKRSIDGMHHRVSVEHLDRYLAQLDFLFSRCQAVGFGYGCAC